MASVHHKGALGAAPIRIEIGGVNAAVLHREDAAKFGQTTIDFDALLHAQRSESEWEMRRLGEKRMTQTKGDCHMSALLDRHDNTANSRDCTLRGQPLLA